ncbi:MAG: squalene--hopene cyclase [Pseudomonadota bacterium]
MNGKEKFIGIVCGLKSEKTAVRAVAGRRAIRIGVSGASAARAEEIARRFCHEGAAAILSVGVSGGLDPALKPGALVIGDSVMADSGELFESDRYLMSSIASSFATPYSLHPEESRRRVSKDKGNRAPEDEARVGRLFGADAIIDSAAKKAALFSNHGALAVDMESHGAARAAQEARVPFIAIRAIADPADRALPPAALSAVAPDGSTQVLKTLGAALRDPKQFPALMKLGADSAAATKTLRRELGPIFEKLAAQIDL